MNREQLLKRLRDVDEVFLLELLNLTSDDLVDAFYDRILERYSYIENQLDESET